MMQGLVTSGTTKQLTHRPSRLDSEHTACGLRLDDTTHLHLGEGQTCECCAHVVEQVASALRGDPSWASGDANRYQQSLGAKWMCEAIVKFLRSSTKLDWSAQRLARMVDRKWEDLGFWRPAGSETAR
jgi:hypothetical protein